MLFPSHPGNDYPPSKNMIVKCTFLNTLNMSISIIKNKLCALLYITISIFEKTSSSTCTAFTTFCPSWRNLFGSMLLQRQIFYTKFCFYTTLSICLFVCLMLLSALAFCSTSCLWSPSRFNSWNKLKSDAQRPLVFAKNSMNVTNKSL